MHCPHKITRLSSYLHFSQLPTLHSEPDAQPEVMELAVLLLYSNLKKYPEYPCKGVGIQESPLLQK